MEEGLSINILSLFLIDYSDDSDLLRDKFL